MLLAETPAETHEPVIAVPEEPQPERPNGFPFVMVIAPVIVALVLYAILRSPFMLIFAVFGPVLGIASVIDQRVGAKRRFRRATEEHAQRVEECLEAAAAAHSRVRARAFAVAPLADAIAGGFAGPITGLTLGTTTVSEQLRTSGNNPQLAAQVSRVAGMPHTVTGETVVLVGGGPALLGVARAIVVSLLAKDSAATLAVLGDELATIRAELAAEGILLVAGPTAERVLTSLPNRQQEGVVVARLDERDGDSVTDDEGVVTSVALTSLSAPQFRAWLPRVAAAQRARAQAQRALPDLCALEDLAQPQGAQLRATFLVDELGGRAVDLVRDGPHAVIGGTTGSGKSELLLAWAIALASSHNSDELSMLFLDFKGGATFDPLGELPQCSGIVTDLDGDEALRVSSSLRAEVRRREQWLRDHGLREIPPQGVAGLTRLVVFIDEFQALIHAHPQLQELIADVAARGRSLGVHLVLCTQRPTGVFREELLANCSLRICLRVEQASDSHTLLGNSDAAQIKKADRGRAWLRTGNATTLVQVALAGPTLTNRVARSEAERIRRSVGPGPSKIWHPPLPQRLELDAATQHEPEALNFGLVDLPEQQEQRPARLRAGEQLFVLGSSATGKTSALRALEHAAKCHGWECVRVPMEAELAWDELARLTTNLEPSPRPRLVLIDDLDSLEHQFDDEHRAAVLERIQLLLRTGAQRRTSVAVSARRNTGQLLRIHQQCDTTLRLANPSRNDWILLGGEPTDWQDGWTPGRGRLDRDLAQIAWVSASPSSEISVADHRWQAVDVASQDWAIVARRCVPIAQRLREVGSEPLAPPTAAALREQGITAGTYLGDVEQWIGAYGAIARVSEHRDVALIGVTAGEWRSLFRADPLAPAVRDPASRGLLRQRDGRVRRLKVLDGVPVAIER